MALLGGWLPRRPTGIIRAVPNAAPTTPRPGADLEAVVDTLSFEPVLHFQAGLAASQRLVVDSRSRAPMYLSHGGPVHVRHTPSGWQGVLRPGDVLFFPHAGRHEVATDLDAPAVPAMDFARSHSHDGRRTFSIDPPDATTRVFGTYFWTRELEAQPLLAGLPRVVMLQPDGCSEFRWVEPMSQLMRWMTDLHAGGSAVGVNESANALLRQVVLAVLRFAEKNGRDLPALRTLRQDAGIAPALRAIHTEPAREWSVPGLAALCHMSRTAFCERFGAAVGEAPLRYLTRWRMTKARQLLTDPALSLEQVAERVGYANAFAFSKAYKRETKASPRATASA